MVECEARCGGASGSGGIGGGAGTGGLSGTGGTPEWGDDPIKTLTVETDEFVVEPGEEAFRCQNFANPFGTGVDILETRSTMAPGSHHLLVFYQDGARSTPLETCSGLEFQRFLHLAQTPEHTVSYPDGVARRLEQPVGLRFNMHYLNTTTEPIRTRIRLHVTAARAGYAQELAGSLFFNNMNVGVEPHATSSTTKSCSVPGGIRILDMVSHMHRHATHIVATTTSGIPLYEGTDWDEPELVTFSPPIAIDQPTEVTWTCTYQNDDDYPLTFGDSAASNEMCILAGSYYPLTAESVVGCVF